MGIRWETNSLEPSIYKGKDLIQLCNKKGVLFIAWKYSLWSSFSVE